MTTLMTSGVTRSAGADIYFERRGDGPSLLMITAAGLHDLFGRL